MSTNEIELAMRRIAREEAEAVTAEAMTKLAPLTEPVLKVVNAAKLTDFEPSTIRKWLCQGTIKNYGRPGAPRVKLSEILNLEG